MERLTEVDKVGAYLIKCRTNPCKDLKGKCGTCTYMQEVVEKLALYENMEEQGLLLKFPCKRELRDIERFMKVKNSSRKE